MTRELTSGACKVLEPELLTTDGTELQELLLCAMREFSKLAKAVLVLGVTQDSALEREELCVEEEENEDEDEEESETQ